MQKRYDIVGRKFNKLTVLSFSHTNNHRVNYWKCLCDCGNETITNTPSLKSGHTKSCGCIQKEFASTLREVTHGDTIKGKITSEYRAWSNMKGRCYDVKDGSYMDYGGRGISVCDRWLGDKDGYLNFLSDMGRKPTPNHSLDRFPDTNGNYEPTNCRWATVPQQNRNRRSNVWVEYNGTKMVMKDFAKINSLDSKHLHRSIKRGYNTGVFSFKEVEKNHYNATNNSQ